MKWILYCAFTILFLSCSQKEREAKDLTDEKEENISPNQTQPEAQSDSTSANTINKDSAVVK